MAQYRSSKRSSNKKDSIPGNILTIVFSFFWCCAVAPSGSSILTLIGLFFLIRSIIRLAKSIKKAGNQSKGNYYPQSKPVSHTTSYSTQRKPVSPATPYSAQSRPVSRTTSYSSPRTPVPQDRPVSRPKTYNPHTARETSRHCRYCNYRLWEGIPDCPNCGKRG